MDKFILILLAICLGYGFRRFKVFPKDSANTLNLFVIYISLPAMILYQIPKLEFNKELLIPSLMPYIAMFISSIIILVLANFFKFSKEVKGCLLLVGVMGNTSFLGIPIINAYYGAKYLPYVIVYDQVGSFLYLATFGTFIVSLYSGNSQVNAKMIVKKVFTFPPFIALILAFLLLGRHFPPFILSILQTLGATIVPLALVAVGLQLQLKLPSHEVKPLSLALIVKLIISPFVAIGAVYVFSWHGTIADVSVLEAGMGPMITAGALASMANLAPRLTAAIVGYGIVFGFFTTAVLYRIIS